MNYVAIYKVSSISKEDTPAHELAQRHKHARRTTDGKHVVFCEVTKDPTPPYIFQPDVPATEQSQVLEWLGFKSSKYPLWVTHAQLKELDAAELLGPAPVVQDV